MNEEYEMATANRLHIILVLLHVTFGAIKCQYEMIPTSSAFKAISVDNAPDGRTTIPNVDFGILGANRVIIGLQNVMDQIDGAIELRLDRYDSTPIARIKVSTGNGVKGELYNVTEMVRVPNGRRDLMITLPSGLEAANIGFVVFREVKPEDKLWYSLISATDVTAKSGLAVSLTSEAVSYQDLVLYTHNCKEYQQLRFKEVRPGEFLIRVRYPKNGVLNLKDSSGIGSPINTFISYGGSYPGSSLWHLQAGNLTGTVKIKSKLTDTCLSSITGLGGNLVAVDCDLGNDKDWFIRYCHV